MRTLLSRLRGVKHETVHAVELWRRAESIKATEKNSTMSDTIGLAVLTMLLLVLSQGMPIEYGSRNENDLGRSAPIRKKQ